MSSAASPQRRSSAVMSLLERMNPLVCINGTTSTLVAQMDDGVADANVNIKEQQDDDVTEEESSDGGGASNNNDIVIPPPRQQQTKKNKKSQTQKSSSRGYAYGCINPLKSKYNPDDKSEELLSLDRITNALEEVVPELLECIAVSSPSREAFAVAEGSSKKLLRKATKEFHAKRSGALQKLYGLTRKEKEYNRVPLVSTEKWNVVNILTDALIASQKSYVDAEINSNIAANNPNTSNNNSKPSIDEDRRIICWTLNNLSIPYENKSTIILGKHFSKLLHALTMVIQSNLPETYLCCICFMNLTFLADAIHPVTFYVPLTPGRAGSTSCGGKGGGGTGGSMRRSSSLRAQSRTASGVSLGSESIGSVSVPCTKVLENSNSLMCIVERMMVTNSPFLLSPVKSVQGEAIRWACGFIRNVTFIGEVTEEGNKNNITSSSANDCLNGSTGRQGIIPSESIEEICTLISRTEIPRLIVSFVRDSPRPTVKWTKDSLEDISLGIMCNLAQWPPSREALRRSGALQCLEKIEGLAGIHGYRARAIRCSLGALPLQLS